MHVIVGYDRVSKVALIMSLLFAAYRPASAGNINLVLNGGFETGDFTGWTLINNQNTRVDSFNPNTGTYEADFGNSSGDATVSQTLTDVAGENYTFSFWQGNGAAGGDFSAAFDSTVLLSEVNPAATGGAYTQFSYNVVGTGSDTISFSGFNEFSEFLDDVSVVGAESSTPEPSTVVLTGLGCIGLIARYRKKGI